MSADDLESAFAGVLALASQMVPAEAFDEARHYVDHNEMELALDTVAAIIAASGRRVGSELYARFLLLGNELQMDESFWESIRPV